MTDIVERLQKATLYEGNGELSALPEEAADEIAALRAENERLRAVLEGIADLPPGYADMRQDDLVVILANKARAAITQENTND